MNKIRIDERGAALVMVLWIIVLLVLLGTILSAQLLTTTKQMKRQEESAIKTDIINMATIYVSTYIKQNGGTDGLNEEALPDIIAKVPTDIEIDNYKAELKPELQEDKSQIELTVTVEINDSESTEVKYISVSK
ncbi:hypothetical protein SAMN05421663_10795 [Terribacillus halophilus]|uniref:Type II secretory pathway, pseudopilin PulG n=1 Tax=Terribacillus halophilus TaxID=361279 RepID=A0A1G6SFZ2_9BACI|nr:hypothetical protein [Terribacillus halophilus]SDD15571.1 hypothetical protein SAMN05421663_10795 [Terribacillus halophilus]